MRGVRGRKGSEEAGYWWLLAIILLSLFLVAITIFFKDLIGLASDTPEVRCRESIRLHSVTTSSTSGHVLPDIRCEPVIRRIDASDEERAKRELALAMKHCWDRWRRGEVELFNGTGIFCNPCSYVTFTGASTITGFIDYLATATAPGSEETYAEYLSAARSQGFHAAPLINKSLSSFHKNVLPTTTEYAILFVYARGKSEVEGLEEALRRNPFRTADELAGEMIRGGGWGAGITSSLLFIGSTTAATLGLTTPPGWVATAVIALGTGAGAYLGADERVTAPGWLSIVLLVPNNPGAIRGLGCEYLAQRAGSTGISEV